MSTDNSSLGSEPLAAFLFDLIQDVSVLRPIVRTLAAETSIPMKLLISSQFCRRDKSGGWYAELEELAQDIGGDLALFDSPFAAIQNLQGKCGVLFSASESNLSAHSTNHNVFLVAPREFTRITVQHGHECVGFNQNHEQTVAHGTDVRFAADLLCGWAPIEEMRHLCVSERDKYFELGPPLLLNRLLDQALPRSASGTGLVCENLHSVRMRTTGAFQQTYLETLLAFADAQGRENREVALRPHPGGQFVIKNNIALPDNVVLANNPMFKTDLSRFSYGISAPSSVLIDMVLAGIPTAVWRDTGAVIDTSGYEGLATVSSLEDWVSFANIAISDPRAILARQNDFLKRTYLDVAPETVRDRLLDLVASLTARHAGVPPRTARPARILLVANGVIPTLHISFLKPLMELEQAGRVIMRVITEKDILHEVRSHPAKAPEAGTRFAISQIEAFRPDIAVFCRYSGPDVEPMMSRLRAAGVPVLFHIDDDLLHVPETLGAKKFAEHNRIERTSTIKYLLDHADAVYCSTRRLRERLMEIGIERELLDGKIYCFGEIAQEAERRPVRTIGFMGNDKTPELSALIPTISRILSKYPLVRFELFGSMAMPDELAGFGDRVSYHPPVGDYDGFVETFRQMQWDIGLCPLHNTPFNLVKANTKWVDYTSIGAAVIASRGTAYDECCEGGCGILVDDPASWEEALQTLIDDADRRYEQVVLAQAKVRREYTVSHLTDQVLNMFAKAQNAAAEPEDSHPQSSNFTAGEMTGELIAPDA